MNISTFACKSKLLSPQEWCGLPAFSLSLCRARRAATDNTATVCSASLLVEGCCTRIRDSVQARLLPDQNGRTKRNTLQACYMWPKAGKNDAGSHSLRNAGCVHGTTSLSHHCGPRYKFFARRLGGGQGRAVTECTWSDALLLCKAIGD